MGSPPPKNILPWRRSVRNGVVLGAVLSFHGCLLLLLLTGHSDWQVPVSTAVSGTDALVVEFLYRTTAPLTRARKTSATVAPAVVERPHPTTGKRSSTLTESEPVHTPEPASVAASRANARLDLDPPDRQVRGGFGNHPLIAALSQAQASQRPRLPGVSAGVSVRRIRLIPRTSLKEGVEAAGKFMNCSIAIMKRHAQSDTPQHINHEHDEYGCTK